MARTATLLVHAPKDSSALTRLVAAVDAQTLPYSSFDVVYLVPPSMTATRARLDELSRRRPNVRVGSSGTSAEVTSAAQEASGDWLVYLGARPFEQGSQLLPDTLEQLTGFGVRHSCELVIGRTDLDAGRVVNDFLTTDRARVDEVPASMLIDCFPIAMRREFAATHGLPFDTDAAERILAAAENVGVLGRRACVVLDTDAPEDPARPVVESCALQWRDGRAVFTISGSAPDVPAGARLRLAVRRRADRTGYWIDAESATIAPDGTFGATVSVDVRTAADGEPLADGQWQVTVGAHGDDLRWSRRVPLLLPTAGPALVDGQPVVPMRLNRRLALDVGGSRASVIPHFDADDVIIEDSVRGTRLTVRLDELAVTGDATLPGFVLLGNFRLPAQLVARDGQAQLVAMLSGLAGTSELKTKFGWDPPHPTGLNLVISPTGQMSVVPTPAPQQPAPARPPSPVRRVRRAVPAPLEPAVRALARSSVVRRAYRRLSGSTSR